jgi:hypothetical protein
MPLLPMIPRDGATIAHGSQGQSPLLFARRFPGIACADSQPDSSRGYELGGGVVECGGDENVPIEMNMRHGMPPIIKMQSLGMEPSLSTDVECMLTADFFTQMRSMLNLQRVLVLGPESKTPLICWLRCRLHVLPRQQFTAPLTTM